MMDLVQAEAAFEKCPSLDGKVDSCSELDSFPYFADS